jgi:hypothetical protein
MKLAIVYTGYHEENLVIYIEDMPFPMSDEQVIALDEWLHRAGVLPTHNELCTAEQVQ